jgi:hypothetical protein
MSIGKVYAFLMNCVREAIHEFVEIKVLHIGGNMNPLDIFTKEFKADEVFHQLHDLLLSPHLGWGVLGYAGAHGLDSKELSSVMHITGSSSVKTMR